MPTMIELLEKKRRELGETQIKFSQRFPGKLNASNADTYSKFKKGRLKLPKAWASVVAELIGNENFEESGECEKQQRITERRARARLIVAFASEFKNMFLPELIMGLSHVGHGGAYYEGCEYTYHDWNFRTLVNAMLVEHGVDWRDTSAKSQTVRTIIDSIGENDADKLALAISVFDACGYVYSMEEMPELYHRCQYGI